MDETTWIDAAVQRGFHVGYFGKWHLGANDPGMRGAHAYDPHRPARSTQKKQPYSYDRMKTYYDTVEQKELLRGRAPFWGEVDKPKDAIDPFPVMANGTQFLEQWAAGEKEKPFFLTVSSAPPHFPHYLPAEYARIAGRLRETIELPASLEDDFINKPWYQTTPWWPCMDTSVLDLDEWRTVIAYSHAHIMLVDEAIGRIIDTLERLDLSDSTTVVFTADHGDMEGAHNRFDKGPYFYEEVWRIPLIVREPGTPPAHQRAFVSILDVGETLFNLTGAPCSENHPRSGRNLLPLTGTSITPSSWSNLAYGVYDLYNGINFSIRAIRDARWKYVWNPQVQDELYDLEADPHEVSNLIGDPSATEPTSRLREQLMRWLDAIGDTLPDRVQDLPPAGTVMATDQPGP